MCLGSPAHRLSNIYAPFSPLQVHHRLYVCSTAQPGRMIRSPSMRTTVVNVTPGSEHVAASGLKVRLTGA